MPLDWATTQNNLGNALSRLGERESGTERLEEAVEAYRAALQERTRERVPLRLGRRPRTTSAARLRGSASGRAAPSAGGGGRGLSRGAAGVDPRAGAAATGPRRRTTSASRLRRSASGRAARRAWRRRSKPFARRCRNGPASGCRCMGHDPEQPRHRASTLGERESGTERAGGGGRSLSRGAAGADPRAGAAATGPTTQNNLGTALATLGERESGTERLEEAVEAFRAALQEWTRERVPLHWAMTQNNLGIALGRSASGRAAPAPGGGGRSLSRGAAGTTRERVPLQWATTQNNLGTALRGSASGRAAPQRLEEAVEAYRAALQERTRERVPLQWASDPEQPRQRALDARRAGERHQRAGGGGRSLSRGAAGMDPRAGAAGLGR